MTKYKVYLREGISFDDVDDSEQIGDSTTPEDNNTTPEDNNGE